MPNRLARMLVVACVPLIPSAALALLPVPDCEVFLPTGNLQQFGISTAADSIFIWPSTHAGGMLSYEWRDTAGALHGVLQHCPTDQTLTYAMPVSLPLDQSDALFERLNAMLEATRTYSFDDVRREVDRYGGSARITDMGPGRCACDSVGF